MKNVVGIKEGIFFIKVVGKFGIFIGLIKFEEVIVEVIILKWGFLKDDGGFEIINYILEKRDFVNNKWVICVLVV